MNASGKLRRSILELLILMGLVSIARAADPGALPTFTKTAPTTALSGAAALIAVSTSVQARNKQVPPASLPCSDEVKQWWEQVRAAGDEAAKALGQKEEILQKKLREKVYIPDDDDELLSKKDREKMNADIATATSLY